MGVRTLFEITDINSVESTLDVSGARSSLSAVELDSTLRSEKSVEIQSNTGLLPAILAGSVNYALSASVSAESTYPGYSVSKIKDGSRNTTVGPSYSWANNFPAGGKLPESVFLKFSALKTIDSINIYTSAGYELQNYTIKYRTTQTSSWVTLITITGNKSPQRSHVFNPISLLEVRIVCERGSSSQTIYGRINEVEIYGSGLTLPEPTLPNIGVENGMLNFSNNGDVKKAIEYLEYKYEQYSEAFIAQYPGKTADELADIEESTGFNDQQPYIDFENNYGLNSLRKLITEEEDYWLANTSGDKFAYPDPDDAYMDDVEIRSLVNSSGEIKVGGKYYLFLNDGSYYEYVPLPPNPPLPPPKDPIQVLRALRNQQPGKRLPRGVKHKNVSTETILGLPSLDECRSVFRRSGFVYGSDGKWRLKYKVKVADGPFDGDGKLKAWTRSYKKKNNGKWKKRSARIEVYAYGTIVSEDCSGGASIETPIITKRRRKVKTKTRYATGSKVRSGEMSSVHYHEKVGLYTYVLVF